MAALTPAIRFADAEIFHARLRPHGIRFRYSMLALFVDIDRLGETIDIPFFSLTRFAFFGFRTRDHGRRDGSSLRDYINTIHADHGLPVPEKVILTCFPRILGHVFNPIATYAGSDAAGNLTSVVYEVRNTFGQHHSYVFSVTEQPDGTLAAHECDKLFYVSPFMDMPLRYRFLLQPPEGDFFSLRIIERDRDGVVLTALMQARVFVPSRRALLARIARSPLSIFKVLAGIHWQALRLWIGGHHVRPRPEPPQRPVTQEVPGLFSLGQPSMTDTTAKGAKHA